MKLGWCTTDNNDILAARSIGFDFVECCLFKVAAFSDDEFSSLASAVEKSGISAETFNCFYVGGTDLYFSDLKELESYAKMALGRASALGCKLQVLGSGASRAVPDNMTRNDALVRFKKILEINAEVAAGYGIEIAVEPLQFRETNVINTLKDGIDFANEFGIANVGCLADFWHMFMNREGLDAFKDAGDKLIHTHLARPNTDRKAPSTDEDKAALALWADTLKSIGYDKRIALEASMPNGDERIETAAKVAELMKVFR